MNYDILYHNKVKTDDLKRVPKTAQDKIKKAIEERLIVDPVSYGDPLRRSLKGYRKLRVGDYRIIYRLDGHTIVVLKIGHRKDVYSSFMRE